MQLQSKVVNYTNIDEYIKEFDKLDFHNKFEEEDKESIQVAIDRVKDGSTNIHLIYYKNQLIGFVAMSFEQISKQPSNNKADCLSALCIDFLFISNSFRKKHFTEFRMSEKVLDYIIETLIRVDTEVGSIKSIILLPANTNLYDFYANYGFIPLDNHWFYFNIR